MRSTPTPGVAMAIATLAMGATSGIQALLYLSSFGIDGRTDGFFVAFALYTSFGVFSQSIRVTSAPLLVGDEARLTPARVRPGAARDRGAGRDRDDPAGAAAGRAAGARARRCRARRHRIGPADPRPRDDPAALGRRRRNPARRARPLRPDRLRLHRRRRSRASSSTWRCRARPASSRWAGRCWRWPSSPAASMLDGVRSSRSAPSAPKRAATLTFRRFARCAWLVLGSTMIYLAFNGLYVVTLAFASNYSAGDATVLSYAYLFASYLVAATGFALGMSRIADMRRGALADWREVIADTVPAGFRYAMLLVAPGAGGADRRWRDADRRRPALQLRRLAGRLSCGSSRRCSAPGRWPRCWSTCCCRRCSRSAGRSWSTLLAIPRLRPPRRDHRARRRPLRRQRRGRRLLHRPARLRGRPAGRRRRPRQRRDRPRACP